MSYAPPGHPCDRRWIPPVTVKVECPQRSEDVRP